ncbi:helix-turn-helix domain-containing protein [Sinorhizobium mexicanum]|uniref:Helix-turn-helix transcriptional regulator n=1 Tax=Sinorhizobium mexicanum TaxID=375549 RepID=A0A859QI24_9HYPH|nr:AraC family transcriptional regulator [Sinorhizobium mexicanum]MBP1884416.1 AraC-like DNA-binding protein [Sinorhizobium mexicanum]QLL65352.1 helix-turn-helix transcriptional regulator [Sinorhizobium mexicanum]
MDRLVQPKNVNETPMGLTDGERVTVAPGCVRVSSSIALGSEVLRDGKNDRTGAETSEPAVGIYIYPEGDTALSDLQLKRVVAYVLRNMDGPLRVRELAAEVGLSPSHFTRAFSVRLGKSPYAFIMEQRIRHARNLMLNTGQTLTEIAGNCGLADQAHLTRMFRRFEGTTPARWRRLRRSDPKGDRQTMRTPG